MSPTVPSRAESATVSGRLGESSYRAAVSATGSGPSRAEVPATVLSRVEGSSTASSRVMVSGCAEESASPLSHGERSAPLSGCVEEVATA